MSDDLLDLYERAPDDETPEDRRRRLARIRKRRQRLSEAAAALRGGTRDYPFEAYTGTQSDIERLCELGGFDEYQEMLTVVLRNLRNLAERDSHAAMLLLSIPSRKESVE